LGGFDFFWDVLGGGGKIVIFSSSFLGKNSGFPKFFEIYKIFNFSSFFSFF
jgi:hypothetical protein